MYNSKSQFDFLPDEILLNIFGQSDPQQHGYKYCLISKSTRGAAQGALWRNPRLSTQYKDKSVYLLTKSEHIGTRDVCRLFLRTLQESEVDFQRMVHFIRFDYYISERAKITRTIPELLQTLTHCKDVLINVHVDRGYGPRNRYDHHGRFSKLQDQFELVARSRTEAAAALSTPTPLLSLVMT